MPAEIVGRGLGKIHPGGIQAVDGVDLEIARGAVTALIGANGAGKTTLLKLLSGALPPTAGEVELCGVKNPFGERKLLRRLAYVDQELALDPEMTGKETLRLLAALYGVRAGDEIAERFGLASILRRRVASYSGGQKRRLHLAAALLHRPDVIFLDEPTAGLDADGARLLWAELDARAQAGATVLVVGHDLDEIEREAARVILMARGRVIADGAPAALIAEHARDWLRVTLRRAPDEEMLSRLRALASRVLGEGRRIWLEVDDPRRAAEVWAALPDELVEVAAHRRDLRSVHRTLTGGDVGEGRRR